MTKKTYYQKLDIIRIFSCILVFLYHLNILKGGYLAVCIFLVLTSYLACISFLKKKNFSLKEYYKNRLIKIYLPLLIVVFFTIGLISLFPKLNFFNLKPETISVLLGYNNFWQLEANLDYFARHIESPFMHFWYLGILLQFELVFPFIALAFKKLGAKIHKNAPIILATILGLGSFIYFCFKVKTNLMMAYYNTFTRSFSLFFGLAYAFYEFNYSQKKKKIKNSNLNYGIYLGIVLLLSIFIKADSSLMPLAMLLVSLITLRLITYAKINNKKKRKDSNLIKAIALITYEIYLWQYPLIYLIPNLIPNKVLSPFIIIILTIILAILLHLSLDYKSSKKKLRISLFSLFMVFSLFGSYKFIVAKDHTKEMQELEDLLNKNAEMLKTKQEEYAKEMASAEEAWHDKLIEFDAANGNIDTLLRNLQIVGIGDSVMLGAVDNLYEQFPKGYFDAKISRTAWKVKEILEDLINRRLLGNPIIFHLGTNGDCSEECKVKIMETVQEKDVFWLTTTYTKQASFNTKILEFKEKYHYENLHIIDWATISKDHPEYFAADGIHLTSTGRKAYTEAIYDYLYNFYYQKYEQQKNELINNHEEDKKNKIAFYGNDFLLNLYPYIENDYKDYEFNIDKDYNYDSLYNILKVKIDNNTLNKKIILVMSNLENEEYNKLINLLNNYQVYIVTLKKLDLITSDNIKIIDFSESIKNNDNYLLIDGKHLSKEGNIALKSILDNIKW